MSSGLAPLPSETAPRREPDGLAAVTSSTMPGAASVQPWPLVAALAILVVVDLPGLGADPWPFRPGAVEPKGLFAPLVRLTAGEWNVSALRAGAFLAGLAVALMAVRAWRAPAWRLRTAVALASIVVALLLVPAVLLQVGLREATAPWFFTNDSTYQIEIAGDLVLNGQDPYGHDYEGSGLERFYGLDGSIPRHRHPAVHHFAYFPGTALSAAAWRLLPAPFDDYRFLVLLATAVLFLAALLFKAPLSWRLAIGATLAANPIMLRGAWFGSADAVSLLFLVLAFALLTRSRYAWAAASLGAAVLLKQFALVAVPFFIVMLIARDAKRATLRGAALVFGAVVLAGFLPFALADPAGLWDDTIRYGTGTYTIQGYGLAPLLIRAGVLDGGDAAYPFGLVVLLIWLPVTAWLLWNQLRARALWVGAVGFAISIFLLLFLARVFHPSYLVWPLVGVALAALLALVERAQPEGPSSVRRQASRSWRAASSSSWPPA
ncbi:MAG TPA: glycosyltransferase 87 family protein [Gaiellaceae bacterium]|nr:glycosyltransferase 87 family protein [Gaiellaceae bacterium]